MKQVRPSTYDEKYYHNVYGGYDPIPKLDFHKVHDYYSDLAKIYKPQKGEKVVDFGCGVGNLSFFLAIKKHANVLGIDYSKSAIKISQKRLRQVKGRLPKGTKIRFENLNNNQLPKQNNISAVYMCDVIEHMYNHEIKHVFEVFKEWNKEGIKVAIHTDNLLYLRLVRPFFDIINIITGTQSINDLRDRKTAEDKVHVNLTSPNQLKKTLSTLGYKEVSRSYPTPTSKRISKQLGSLSTIPFMKEVVKFSLKFLSPLSPSFFAVYQYSKSR